MKVPYTLLFSAAVLIAGSGCRSKQPVVAEAAPAPTPVAAPTTASAPHPRIRVESIPNPQLTPTSREGDRPGPVYSSNIIAVYIDTNGVGTTTSNFTVMPAVRQ